MVREDWLLGFMRFIYYLEHFKNKARFRRQYNWKTMINVYIKTYLLGQFFFKKEGDKCRQINITFRRTCFISFNDKIYGSITCSIGLKTDLRVWYKFSEESNAKIFGNTHYSFFGKYELLLLTPLFAESIEGKNGLSLFFSHSLMLQNLGQKHHYFCWNFSFCLKHCFLLQVHFSDISLTLKSSTVSRAYPFIWF